MWKSYLMPGADSPVNLSDNIIRRIEPKIEACDPDAFDLGYNELLQVTKDSISLLLAACCFPTCF